MQCGASEISVMSSPPSGTFTPKRTTGFGTCAGMDAMSEQSALMHSVLSGVWRMPSRMLLSVCVISP